MKIWYIRFGDSVRLNVVLIGRWWNGYRLPIKIQPEVNKAGLGNLQNRLHEGRNETPI